MVHIHSPLYAHPTAQGGGYVVCRCRAWARTVHGIITSPWYLTPDLLAWNGGRTHA